MARRGSGGALFEPVEVKRDREVTLGPGMLAVLGIGLLTLCGVCFVFGYGVGHRSSPQTSLQQAIMTNSAPSLALSAQAKPSASADGSQPVSPQAPDHSNAAIANPDASDPATAAAAPAVAPPGGVPVAHPGSVTPPAAVVQTALPVTPGSGQPMASNGLVHPALAPAAGNWVVQIAAVSQPEDANVLVTALRKRGYSVSVRRDPVDNLMHVQVGPFTLRTDAATMRQRLLNDGYNAIVEP